MAKFMLLFIGNDEASRGWAKEDLERLYAGAAQWFAENGRKGVVVGGEELRPASGAKTIRRQGYRPDGMAIVTDGPFVESKETIGGFAIVEVADIGAAVALAKTWPTGGTVEVREVVTR